jgi:hypothetical protein
MVSRIAAFRIGFLGPALGASFDFRVLHLTVAVFGHIFPYAVLGVKLVQELSDSCIWSWFRDMDAQTTFKLVPSHGDLIVDIADIGRAGIPQEFLGKCSGGSTCTNISISVRHFLQLIHRFCSSGFKMGC